MAGIVVGVDGSEPSKAALHWAVEEARLRGAPLRVVYAWSVPMVLAPGVAVPQSDVTAVQADAKRLVDAFVDEVATDELTIDGVAVQGAPASVLVDAAKDADLLVVGSRGRGGFAELLLGSVSHQCAHHAPCAVVIVRH